MDCLGKKHAAHLPHLHDPQLKLCEVQDSWLSPRADDIQGYADKNDMKDFYSSLKEVYNPTSADSSLPLSADGTNLI